jgi:hypothetical protein
VAAQLGDAGVAGDAQHLEGLQDRVVGALGQLGEALLHAGGRRAA